MNNKIIIFILILFIVFGGFYFYNNNNQSNFVYKQNLLALSGVIKKTENRYGKIINEKASFILESKERNKIIDSLKVKSLGLKKQLKKFSNNNTLIITKTEIKIDTLKLYIDRRGGFKSVSEHYSIEGVVKDSLQLNKVRIFNDQSIIFGEKKRNIFGKRILTAQITNSNPFIKVENLQSFTYIPKSKKFNIGVQTGIGITSDLQIKVYFGIGVSYTLISF